MLLSKHTSISSCDLALCHSPAAYISACAGIVLLLAALLQPFMPSFTRKVLAQLGVEQGQVRR
jgi:methionyl-tRNA synthetase